MTSTTTMGEKAERWGRLWGARAGDWAATEEQQLPTYAEALDRLGGVSGSGCSRSDAARASSSAQRPTGVRA